MELTFGDQDHVWHLFNIRNHIDIEIALLQQLLNIAREERIAKIPPDREG